ncbi:MAG: ABC transporter permease [Nitrospiraceae bacterium]
MVPPVDMMPANGPPASLERSDDLTVSCGGAWTLAYLGEFHRRLLSFPWPESTSLICDATGITAMDVSGAWLLQRSLNELAKQGRRVELRGLRPEFAQLLQIVSTIQPSQASIPAAASRSVLDRIGRRAWNEGTHILKGLAFLGESSLAVARLLAAPRLIRWRALIRSVELNGFNALPIVELLSFLMGVVIAYQGAEQLRKFGTNIFIVDLVGISLLREIAPLVTAILVAGHSGSAYAAQLGTMEDAQYVGGVRFMTQAGLSLSLWGPLGLLMTACQ